MSVEIFQIYKISILEKDNYSRENFSINLISFSEREYFCGLAESRTTAQHNCHDDLSFNFNSLVILLGAEVKDVISSICSSVSQSSLSKKSSSVFERSLVAMKSSTNPVSSKDILINGEIFMGLKENPVCINKNIDF